MPPKVRYIERFEYFCKGCGRKGTVIDVLLNPEVLLIRGHCEGCNAQGAYKVVDIDRLRKEYASIVMEESEDGEASKRLNESTAKKSEFLWKRQP
jgi:hypothetical protein